MTEQPGTIRFMVADGRVDRRGDLVRGSAFSHLVGTVVRGIRQHQRGSAAIGAGPLRVSPDGERAWVDVTLAPTVAGRDYAAEVEFLREQGVHYAPSVGAVYSLRNVRLRGAMSPAERSQGARRVIDRVESIREVSSVDVSALPGHTLTLQREDGDGGELSEVVFYLERDDGLPEEPAADSDAGQAETPEVDAPPPPEDADGDAASPPADESAKIALAVEMASATETQQRVGRLLNA